MPENKPEKTFADLEKEAAIANRAHLEIFKKYGANEDLAYVMGIVFMPISNMNELFVRWKNDDIYGRIDYERACYLSILNGHISKAREYLQKAAESEQNKKEMTLISTQAASYSAWSTKVKKMVEINDRFGGKSFDDILLENFDAVVRIVSDSANDFTLKRVDMGLGVLSKYIL